MKAVNKNPLDKIMNIIAKFVEITVVISVGAISLILITNVFFRYVLNKPIVGADEVALLLLVWITFLGACLGIRRREMIAVTFLIEKVSKTSYKIIQILIQISILLFSLLLLYYGFEWLTSSSIMNAKSSALRIPLWIPYLIFPTSMLIMVVFSLDNIRYLLKNKEEG